MPRDRPIHRLADLRLRGPDEQVGETGGTGQPGQPRFAVWPIANSTTQHLDAEQAVADAQQAREQAEAALAHISIIGIDDHIFKEGIDRPAQ